MLLNLAKSKVNYRVDNTFVVFKSLKDIICIIYSIKNENKYNSIASYNLTDYKKIVEIKNAQDEDISNFRNFFDKLNKRDLIISISSKDNNYSFCKI